MTAPIIRRVSILGATGSVGCTTVDVIEAARAQGEIDCEIEAITAHARVDELIELALRLRPRFAAIADEALGPRLRAALAPHGIATGAGVSAIVEAAARPADWVMAAIVGTAGLRPTLEAVRRGATVALANKECLVSAGACFMREARASGATVLPVDSEHNAIFQLFDFKDPESVEKLILTASGGPFRKLSREEMLRVTPAQAVAHPNWSMGAKISVDSATLMNKGLELIEAHHLFGMTPGQLDVVIHPESIVHSFVAYRDGSMLAHMAAPDMRIPVAYALGWPRRLPTETARLDLHRLGSLNFSAPDEKLFPCLGLARAALRRMGTAPTILNAANEVAVAAFLGGAIGFLDIAAVVEDVLEESEGQAMGCETFDDALETDRMCRRMATRAIAARSPEPATAKG